MCRQVKFERLLPSIIILAVSLSGFSAIANRPVTKGATTAEAQVVDADVKNIRNQLKAIDLIFKSEKNQEKRTDLLIRKAGLLYKLAHYLGIKRDKASQIGPEEKKHLAESEQLLKVVAPQIKASDKIRMATIYYIRGSILYELNKVVEGRDAYIQSMKLDKKSEAVSSMAMIVAEQYFDDEDYKKAISFYRWIYPRLTGYQKVLANYKIAWSFVGMRDFAQAESYFLRVIGNKTEKDFREDGLRDLAFTVTQHRTEDEILSYATESFKNENLRAKFLTNVLKVYYQQDKKLSREKTFEQALRFQKLPEEHLALLFLKVQFERRETPTKRWSEFSQDFIKALAEADSKVREKFLFSAGTDLEDNLGQAIKVYTDAYLGKLKVSEEITKESLGKAMSGFIDSYLLLFPKSDKIQALYDLWMDLCSNESDANCLAKIQTRMEKDKHLGDLKVSKSYHRVWLEQLNILDKSAQKDPAQVDVFIQKTDAFISQFPRHDSQLKLSKKVAFYLLNRKDNEKALPYLLSIYSLEPTAPNLEAVYQIKFALKKYEEIVKDKEGAKFKSSELTNLKQQAHLQMAITASNSDDFDEYEVHLKNFLSSGPSQDKAVIAYVDYFDKILKTKDLLKCHSEWKSVADSYKTDSRFQPVKLQLLDRMKETGTLIYDESLFAGISETQGVLDILLVRLATDKFGDPEDQARFNRLTEAQQNYFAGLLSLSKPDKLLEFMLQRKKLNSDNKKAMYFSSLLKKGTLRAAFTQEEATPFRELVPATAFQGQPSKIEKKISDLVVPKVGTKTSIYNKRVESLVSDLRWLRKKVPGELKKVQFQHQLSLLSVAKEREEQTAQAIIDSPLPEGLTPEQSVEYKQGLSELAQEFKAQAQEYIKLREGLEKQYSDMELKEKSEQLPKVDADDWKFPSSSVAKQAVKISDGGSVVSALIFLDANLAKKKIETEDYYRARTGLLLKLHNNEVMRDFLKSELTQANQEKTLKYWKEQKS